MVEKFNCFLSYGNQIRVLTERKRHNSVTAKGSLSKLRISLTIFFSNDVPKQLT